LVTTNNYDTQISQILAENYSGCSRFFWSDFLFGWGVMIWCLSAMVYDKAPEFVRKSVLIGVLAWFILDSSGSIASGNISNAFFNIIVLIIAVGPLWIPAKTKLTN